MWQAGLEEKYHFNIAFQRLILGDADTDDQLIAPNPDTHIAAVPIVASLRGDCLPIS